jgi:CubicO group peptidase (beta-lactamase class C family)
MKRFVGLFITLALLAFPAFLCTADPVDTLIKTEMEKHQIAGISLAVIQNGRTTKTACYGVANLELQSPVTPDTMFEIGSVTKQFTAACILLLAQDGKLSIEDKISKYLTNTPPAWSNITIRHLLTHTSGLTNYTKLDGFELRRHLTQEQFIKLLGAQPVVFAPGDKWDYCNSGFNLLGYIIENVSGQSYWNFLRARILQPLGMNATTDRNPHFVVPHRAAGYELANHVSVNRDYDLTDIFSAGAILSDVPDMTKWNAALDGETLLTKASKELMWTPAKLNNGQVQNYGFGWFLDALDGHKNIGHNGATSGFSASIQRFPHDGLAIILLCNADEMGISTTIAKKVAKLYFASDDQARR